MPPHVYGQKIYEVSTMEIDRDTDSYMIFTVNEIFGANYKDAQLFLDNRLGICFDRS